MARIKTNSSFTDHRRFFNRLHFSFTSVRFDDYKLLIQNNFRSGWCVDVPQLRLNLLKLEIQFCNSFEIIWKVKDTSTSVQI